MGRTPSAKAVLTLVLIVAALFLLGGAPLQFLLGEPGLIVSQVGLLLLPAILFVRWGRFDMRSTLSLRLPTAVQITGGSVLLLGGIQMAWFLAWAQSLWVPIPVEYLEALNAALSADSISRFLWLLLIAAVVPAVAEEVLFRGVILSGFRSSMATVWAVVGAGVVFGIFHLTPETAFRFLPTAWLGVLLGWVVVVSGSLPLAILLHFGNNALILLVTAIPYTRERVAAPEADPPLLLLPVALALLALGGMLLARGGSPRDPRADRSAGGTEGGGIAGRDAPSA